MHRIKLLLGMRMADVQNVQQQIGMNGFFERRLEAGDQIVRQIAHETDGIAQQNFRAALQLPRAGLGIERGEEFVVRIRARGGQRVEQRAFAGVGVSDDAGGEMLARSLGDQAGLAILNFLDLQI